MRPWKQRHEPPAANWLDRLDAWIWPERNRLPLFAPLMLGGGIALWFELPHLEQRQAALCFALATAAVGLLLRGFPRAVLVGAGLLVAVGMGFADWRSDSVAAPRLYHRMAGPVSGTVAAMEARQRGTDTILILALDSGGKLRLRAGALPAFVQPGARIRVSATLLPVASAQVPGGFDHARAAWFSGVGGFGRVTSAPELIAAAPPPGGFRLWLGTQRVRLTRWILETVGGDAGGIAAALITGDQGHISPATLDAMRASGLQHLLSVSGYHIGVVLAASLLLFRKLLSLWSWLALWTSVRTLSALLAGLLTTMYTLLAGAEVPAVRACLMAWVVVAALLLGRNPLSFRLLAFAAVSILLWRPEAALAASFQLSFAAVVALVLASSLRSAQEAPEGGRKWLRRGTMLLLGGLAIEAMLAPVAAFHFGRIGLYGAVANLAAIPLASAAIMPSLFALLAAGLAGLEAPFAWLSRLTIDVLIGLANHVAGWPGAVLSIPAFPSGAFILMMGGVMLVALLGTRRRWLGLLPAIIGMGWAVASPAPELLISSDGRHVAVVDGGRLLMLRPRATGFVADAWSEAIAPRELGALEQWTASRCNAVACAATLRLDGGSLRLLAFRSGLSPDRASLVLACASADLVVSDRALPRSCRPRWLLLDRVALKPMGATAIYLPSRRVTSVGEMQGDHPWSPAAPVGTHRTLLGATRWTEPIS